MALLSLSSHFLLAHSSATGNQPNAFLALRARETRARPLGRLALSYWPFFSILATRYTTVKSLEQSEYRSEQPFECPAWGHVSRFMCL